MPVGVIVPLVLLVALVVVAALIVRRMGQIAATDRALRAYAVAVADLRRDVDPVLERFAASVDAFLRGRGTAGAAAVTAGQASADLARARQELATRGAPAELRSLHASLERALDGGLSALDATAAALGRLEVGTPRDDPDRLAVEREAKRGRLATLAARDEMAAIEGQIGAAVAGARARTQRRQARGA